MFCCCEIFQIACVLANALIYVFPYQFGGLVLLLVFADFEIWKYERLWCLCGIYVYIFQFFNLFFYTFHG
jgi:hypothetical protein